MFYLGPNSIGRVYGPSGNLVKAPILPASAASVGLWRGHVRAVVDLDRTIEPIKLFLIGKWPKEAKFHAQSNTSDNLEKCSPKP